MSSQQITTKNVENSNCTFDDVLRNKQTRPRLIVLANFIVFISCFPSQIPRDIAFIPSTLNARAKMAGILNKVFFEYEIVTLNHSTVGLVFGKLGLYVAHTEFLIVEAAGTCQIWGSCHI